MDNIDMDFNQIINGLMLSSIEKDNPQTAKLLKVFIKRGFNVQESLAILLEIGQAIQEE